MIRVLIQQKDITFETNKPNIVCLVTKSRLCYPTDCSPPGSSVHGISQARILAWVAISSRGFHDPGIEPAPPTLSGWIFTTAPPGKPTAQHRST